MADYNSITGVTFAGGVSNCDILAWDAGNTRFDKACVDTTWRERAVGVADVSNSQVIISGRTPAGLMSGLTAGGMHYLSAGTAGATSTTKPTDCIIIGTAESSSRMVICITWCIVQNGVRQTKQYIETTHPASTITSLISTGVEVALDHDLRSTASKCLVRVVGNFGITGPANYVHFSLFRNSTDLTPGVVQGLAGSHLSDSFSNRAFAIEYLDSPATTTPPTYKLVWKVENATVFLGRRGQDDTNVDSSVIMTVQEVIPV